ncbi:MULTISPECIES: MarR family winged helix-turn-helix transcriptional regulator [unclassified Crossiella]|uniref:MarR family winged helix-turn-helix transcriptional regulator n=1 Tax=unclassified Crossiella TaxID=2620835 RepID=UPI001FFF6580|nr:MULTISPECIES: MarR family transcriptional regulator [unclassified Crossiella]MCK2240829.1 MarR family transcriptional regulator [Crossiella sp. S99.2]MCK2254027.1 MarR family transcriptional regulator [Crossiella sp. S99.1]
MHHGGYPQGGSSAFLLAQLGFAAARRFAERLAPLDLEPRHVGLLRMVAGAEGQSQQAIGERMRIAPSRMVAFVDDLEHRGLVQRRRNPADRRAYALHLTDRGRELLETALAEAATHDAEVTAPLTEDERTRLHELLTKLAGAQDLEQHRFPGGHPRATREC